MHASNLHCMHHGKRFAYRIRDDFFFTRCSTTCDSEAQMQGHQMGTPCSLGKFGLINQSRHMVAELPARRRGWGVAGARQTVMAEAWLESSDIRGAAKGVLERMRDGRHDSSRWRGWRVAVLNPLRLGVPYSVHQLGGRSKGGWEGKPGSNTTGKYVYEQIFTSHALVESLVL